MPKACCIPFCPSRGYAIKAMFFTFPKAEGLAARWREALLQHCGMVDIPKSPLLCHEHFRVGIDYDILGNGRPLRRHHAVPSIFPEVPRGFRPPGQPVPPSSAHVVAASMEESRAEKELKIPCSGDQEQRKLKRRLVIVDKRLKKLSKLNPSSSSVRSVKKATPSSVIWDTIEVSPVEEEIDGLPEDHESLAIGPSDSLKKIPELEGVGLPLASLDPGPLTSPSSQPKQILLRVMATPSGSRGVHANFANEHPSTPLEEDLGLGGECSFLMDEAAAVTPVRKKERPSRRTRDPNETPSRHDHNYFKVGETPPRLKRLTSNLKDVKTKARKLSSDLLLERKKNKRLKFCLQKMKDVVAVLKKKSVPEKGIRLLTEGHGEAMQELLQMKKMNLTRPKEYSTKIREFALLLHFHSPRAYRFLRKQELPLPAPSTLRLWLSHFTMDPGFLTVPLLRLKKLAQESKEPVLVGLMFDEIHLKSGTWVQGGRHVGYVDLGLGIEAEKAPDGSYLAATEGLVLMAVGINKRFRVPIYYALSNPLKGEKKASLISGSIVKLKEECGVRTAALTCDGLLANRRTMQCLGVNYKLLLEGKFDPSTCSFPDPSWKGEEGDDGSEDISKADRVYVFFDAAHMLKLLRNNLATAGSFKWEGRGVVSWDYIKLLHDFQAQDKMRLANKLAKKHIEYEPLKMNVSVAAQTISRSVAVSLQVAEEDLKLPEFAGAGATADFLLIADTCFDLLNSHAFDDKRWQKQPLTHEHKAKWKKAFQEMRHALLSLKTVKKARVRRGEGPVKKPRLTSMAETTAHRKGADEQGTGDVAGDPEARAGETYVYQTTMDTFVLGFLLDIASAENMFHDLCDGADAPLSFLRMYRTSQDHLECFFGAIRATGGCNNKPSAADFKYAMRKCTLLRVRDVSKGNCMMQEEMSMLAGLKAAEKVEEEYELAWDQFPDMWDSSDHDYIEFLEACSTFKATGSMYISGYVVRTISRLLHCEECGDMLQLSGKELEIEEENVSRALLRRKDRGGLVHPSRFSAVLGTTAERVFQNMTKGLPLPNVTQRDLVLATIKVMNFTQLLEFIQNKQHVLHDVDEDLLVKVSKVFLQKYFSIKMRHVSREFLGEKKGVSRTNAMTKSSIFMDAKTFRVKPT